MHLNAQCLRSLNRSDNGPDNRSTRPHMFKCAYWCWQLESNVSICVHFANQIGSRCLGLPKKSRYLLVSNEPHSFIGALSLAAGELSLDARSLGLYFCCHYIGIDIVIGNDYIVISKKFFTML